MTIKIWHWDKDLKKVYVEGFNLKRRIERWENSKLHCTYFYPDGSLAWDFIVPAKLCKKLKKVDILDES